EPATNPAELTEEAGGLLEHVSPSFDWVVIDTPPLLAFADAHSLATHADGILLVVRSGITSREDFEVALGSIEGSFLAGVVINGSENRKYESYYAHYRHSDANNPRTEWAKQDL
ncbi:MAG: hypothetical protein ABI165_04240, partial [Bryobacteraceae bacterium]